MSKILPSAVRHSVEVVAALVLCCALHAARAAPGDLDASFGAGGTVTTAIGAAADNAYAMAIQHDGRIIAAGTTTTGLTTDCALVRYTGSGALDTTFNGTGKVVTPLSAGNDGLLAVAVQPDGKIVAAGYTTTSGNVDFAVVRYTSSGALDAAFNGTGIASAPVGPGTDIGYGMAVQPDGMIVVGGYASNGSNNDFALVRFTAAGALDASFGTGGKVITPVGAGRDECYAVALQSDGGILLAGRAFMGATSDDFAVARYTPSGVLDTSFNGTGIVTTHFGPSYEYAWGVAVQGDGGIVLSGYAWTGSREAIALARYTSAGALDTTFNGTGKVTTTIGTVQESSRSVVVQGNGKILVAGSSVGGTTDFAVVRYTSSGALDTTFSGDGKQTAAIGVSVDVGWDMALQPDGKIVLAGYSSVGGTDDFSLARFEGDPPGDTDADGLVDAWEAFYWGSAAGHSATGDHDHDGYSELLEQALGLSPLVPDAAGQPAVINEGGYLSMTLAKKVGAAYQVQSAGTLLGAQPDSFSPASTTVLINDATTLKVRDNFTFAGAPRRFMRLQVTAAP